MDKISDIMRSIRNNPHHQALYQQRLEEIRQNKDIQQFIQEHSDQITEEMIQNSISKLDEFVREQSLLEQGLPGQNPGFKPQLIMNASYIDVSYVPTSEFQQMQEDMQRRRRMNNQMMPRQIREANLDHIYQNTPSRKKALYEIVHFINRYPTAPYDVQGLYLSGNFGVGKTYLLGAMANRLVTDGYSVAMLHVPSFLNELKKLFKSDTMVEAIEAVMGYDILILDDIGAESNSAWSRDSVIAPILEYRMRESLPTFFTSNFTIEELEEHFASTREADERVKAKRLMERIRYLAKPIEMDGENLRKVERERQQ